MSQNIVFDCCQSISEKNWKIAFVETITSGKLTYEFSLTPTEKEILGGSFICKDLSTKEDFLQISDHLLEDGIGESLAVSKEMAHNICNYLEYDICVAVTGIINKDELQRSLSKGSIYIHAIFPHKSISDVVTFKGTTEEIILQTVQEVARIVLIELQ